MYKIVITNHFKRQIKRLIKRNRSLKGVLMSSLSNFSKQTAISIGEDIYKIRLQRNNKGKSGGYRLYIYLLEIEALISPVCIYSKSEKENISISELAEHVDRIKEELNVFYLKGE